MTGPWGIVVDGRRAIRATVAATVIALVGPAVAGLLFFGIVGGAIAAAGFDDELVRNSEWQQLRGQWPLLAWMFVTFCAGMGFAIGKVPALLAAAGLAWTTYRDGGFDYEDAALYAAVAVVAGEIVVLVARLSALTAGGLWGIPLLILGNSIFKVLPAAAAALVCRWLLGRFGVLATGSCALPKS